MRKISYNLFSANEVGSGDEANFEVKGEESSGKSEENGVENDKGKEPITDTPRMKEGKVLAGTNKDESEEKGVRKNDCDSFYAVPPLWVIVTLGGFFLFIVIRGSLVIFIKKT